MKIVFVADAFVEQYRGGAELTTRAIIDKSPYECERINSNLVTPEIINKHKDAIWIVCNFQNLDDKMKILLCKNVNYSIIEYDYKFCEFRSMEKHLFLKNKECDCINSPMGKISKIFYGYAQQVWFMSQKQRSIFLEKVPTLKSEKCKVLSSIFSDGDLRFMDNIRHNDKDSKYLILNAGSWIKNTKGCVEFAQENNLDFELVQGLPYQEMLIKLSTSKGLIFLPTGGDTCPRIVIEAKLLGCDLKLNDNVQHKDEDWFSGSQENCYNYLTNRAATFWEFYE